MISISLTNFTVNLNHVTTIVIPDENLVVLLDAISTAFDAGAGAHAGAVLPNTRCASVP